MSWDEMFHNEKGFIVSLEEIKLMINVIKMFYISKGIWKSYWERYERIGVSFLKKSQFVETLQ